MEISLMTNKEMTMALYDYFGQGNVPAILDMVTDDIKWTCPGPSDILPYAQEYHGKEGVEEFFRLIYANKDFPKFEVRELIGEGDKGLRWGTGMQNQRKQVTSIPETGRWRFISEMVSCMNTGSIMIPMVKQWLPQDKMS